MNIGELFIQLGVKGADTTKKALEGVKSGLGEIGESSLAAKAAILGVIVGLERLTGFASKQGAELKGFAVLTGMSTTELQKWQYALDRFGVSGGETANTLKSLQAQMADMRLTGNAPSGLNFLASTVGFDPKKAMDEKTGPMYVLKKLQDFMKGFGKVNPAMANQIAKTFHLSDDMIQGLIRMDLQVDKIREKDIISPQEIERLDEINKAWREVWFTLERIGIKFVAAFGGGIVEHLVGAVRLIADGFQIGFDLLTKMGDKVGKLKDVFLALGFVLAMIFAPLLPTFLAINAIVAGLVLLLGDIQKFREGKDSVIGGITKGISGAATSLTEQPWWKKMNQNMAGSMGLDITPKVSTESQGTNLDQNITNHVTIDARNSSPQEIKQEFESVVNRSYRSAIANGI